MREKYKNSSQGNQPVSVDWWTIQKNYYQKEVTSDIKTVSITEFINTSSK